MLNIGDILVFLSVFVVLGCYMVHFCCNFIVIIQMCFIIVVFTINEGLSFLF